MKSDALHHVEKNLFFSPRRSHVNSAGFTRNVDGALTDGVDAPTIMSNCILSHDEEAETNHSNKNITYVVCFHALIP